MVILPGIVYGNLKRIYVVPREDAVIQHDESASEIQSSTNDGRF